MGLSEIKERWRLSGKAVSAVDPLFVDDALNWLIAEVERLETDNQTLTEENMDMLADCTAYRAEVERLTALCDGYRGEVTALKAVEARVEHIKRSYAGGENWLRCLERAEKAESSLTRARAEGLEEAAKIAERATTHFKVQDVTVRGIAASIRARASKGDSDEG